MTETKQPEALRLSEWLDHHGERTTHSDAADELRRQHAEIEALQADLAHKDDYAEQLGRELAKADSEAKELRAKLDQAVVALKDISNDNWPDAGLNACEYACLVLHELAAGARPVEPVQKLRPDFIAGYDAGMADAKRIQAAQPAPAAEPIDEYQRGRRAGITEFYDSLYAIDQDRARAALHKIEPQPAPDDGWLHSSGMLYRLTDERRPKNRDEINVTMADGSRSLESRSRRAGELLDCIRAMQAAQEPFGYVNTNTGQFFAYVESCRKNNEGHWRTVYTIPQPAPAAQAASITLDFKQATELLEMFGGEPGEITLTTGDGHSGYQLLQPRRDERH